MDEEKEEKHHSTEGERLRVLLCMEDTCIKKKIIKKGISVYVCSSVCQQVECMNKVGTGMKPFNLSINGTDLS